MAKLSFDPDEAVSVLLRADAKLRRLIERAGPFTMRPERVRDTFNALVRSIVYQQLTGKAASTILGRVTALYGNPIVIDPREVFATPDERLREAGLSGSKTAAIKDLAAKTLDGSVPSLARLRRMTDQEIVAALTHVRGIGPWSVEMLLMFRLGRPDVLPVADYGVRKGFQITYGTRELPDALTMTKKAERWRPFRSVGSWYMWRAVDLAKVRSIDVGAGAGAVK